MSQPRRDASTRSTKSTRSTRFSQSTRSNIDLLSMDDKLELEEKESRIALSLSIMHHAMQASNADGSSSYFYPSSRTGFSDSQTIKSAKSGQSVTSETPIEKHLNESGWNLDKIHTLNISNDLSKNTRNRRICMYTCALIASAIISFAASEKMGFPKDNMFSTTSEEKVKYSGNYTDISAYSSNSDGSKLLINKKNYKKEKYKIPENIDGTDDFVDMDQILPILLDANFGDIFNEQNNEKYLMIDDVPYFWLIPRSGGNSVRYVLSYCFKAVLACEIDSDKSNAKELRVIEQDGVNYVNVNTESSEGIKRAKDLNLVNSGLAYAVFSSRINEIVSIFNTNHRARAFTLLRHPVERIISEFYQEQARDPRLALIPLEEYFLNNKENTQKVIGHDNYIVRSIVNKPIADLTSYDLDLAMVILKKKFLIGLVDEMEESINRFRYYFNWKTTGLKGVNECQMTFTSPSPRRKPIVSRTSKVWKFLEEGNKFDVQLYDFALHLFDVQGLFLKQSMK